MIEMTDKVKLLVPKYLFSVRYFNFSYTGPELKTVNIFDVKPMTKNIGSTVD